MRPIVLSTARACLVAFLSIGLMNLPVMAASEKPLGMVVTAANARLDNAKAAIGADVYSGDTLSTDQDGSLRLKVGLSQVYMLSSSSATLEPLGSKVRANVERGSLGFSTTAPDQIEIGTPLGVIRGANGQRVFGQVAMLDASSMRISAYEGTLVVEASNGEMKMIEQGQTYEATLVANSEPGGAQGPSGVGRPGINWKRVVVVAAFVGGAATAAAILWHEATESCTVPSNCD
ncbi:MAG: hypothetical protein LAN36_09840 [Acidobacteriia bacterium]|nr:hypothetical protein [Terriglobia bacterium]